MSGEILHALAPALILAGFYLTVLPWADSSSTLTRTVFLWINIALAGRYLVWRVTSTLPEAELTLGVVLAYTFVSLEIISSVIWFRAIRVFQRTRDRRQQADNQEGWYGSQPPLVDVFIPTYNESAAILEKTIVAARNLDYPRFRVWILDDGRREWLADLAQRHGVRYVTRANNRSFKAGNLNNGLQHMLAMPEPGEFIAVLDADFIVNPRLLRRALSLMRDADVGLVQTPQRFYNPDPFQYAFAAKGFWPDDQRFQFDCRLPARDAQDSAVCCGTSFLVRVTHLEQISGFPTESICEDVLTSVKLQSIGSRTLYLNETLSVGLAPEGLQEFLTQRARWCLGFIQNVRSAWGPLRHGDGVRERLLQGEGMFRWGLHCFLRMGYLCIPMIYWFTGFTFVQGNTLEMLSYVIPLSVQGAAMGRLFKGTQMPLITDATTVLTGFSVVRATLRGVLRPGDHVFNVTDKGVNRQAVVVHWRVLRWLLLVAALTILGMTWHTFEPYASPESSTFAGFHYFWSFYVLGVVLIASIPCIELPKYRSEERFAWSERGLLCKTDRSAPAEVLDLSVAGALLRVDESLAVGDLVTLSLPTTGTIQGRVTRLVTRETVGVAFVHDDTTRERLILSIFTRNDVVQETFSFAKCLRAIIRRALGDRPGSASAAASNTGLTRADRALAT